nr:sulfite exporter TauE/SafE family protein [Kitasatospora phosalacinea]
MLAVPALIYLIGLTPGTATTASLLIVAVTSLTGLVAHAGAGRVRWREGLLFGAAGLPFAALGGALSRHLPGAALTAAFALLAGLAAWRMLAGDRRGGRAGGDAGHADGIGDAAVLAPPPGPARALPSALGPAAVARLLPGPATGPAPGSASDPAPGGAFGGAGAVVVVATETISARTNPEPCPLPAAAATSAATSAEPSAGASVPVRRAALAGAGLGAATGVLGVGGGFLAVPALVSFLAFPMAEAIGTSLLVITLNSLAALLPRLGAAAEIPWSAVGPFAAAAVLGAWDGKRLAAKLSGRTLRRLFASALLAVAALMLVDAVL